MRSIGTGILQKVLAVVATSLILAIAIAIPLGSKVRTGSWRPVLKIGEAQAASAVQQVDGGKAATSSVSLGACSQPALASQGKQGMNCSPKKIAAQMPVGAPSGVLAVSVGDLATFYETIITILGVALAIVAGLAYWSVRLVSRATAEDIAMNAAEKIITDSKKFSDLLRGTIRKYVDREMDKFRESLEPLEEMETRITRIEQKFANEDNAENADGHIEGTGEEK